MAPTVWLALAAVTLFFTPALAVNFPWEAVQLTETAVGNFSALQFGNATAYAQRSAIAPYPECREFPGSRDWPTHAEWARLNGSIDGHLLRPQPAGMVCYPGPAYSRESCQYVSSFAAFTPYWINDPLDVLTQWPEGNTCLASLHPKGNCTRGGYPEYVVNASTVMHIQAAVNFARNRNLRLVIKNTGHDFGGRSVGAGSLSIWVHNLKGFAFLPSYKMGQYTGMAVRYGAGLESWEVFNYMAQYNISVAAPGGSTVGSLGGWLAMGGHGSVTSYLGLGSDQALSIEVVTADGRLVTADPFQNADLFYALRGGGPSTYGVMTSVIMKAFPPMNVTTSSVTIQYDPVGTASAQSPFGFGLPPSRNGSSPFVFPNGTSPFFSNGTNPFSNGSFPNTTFQFPFPTANGTNGTSVPPDTFNFPMPGMASSADSFWTAIGMYYRFGKKVLDAGGMCYGYIYPTGNGSFSFTSSQFLINMSPEHAHQLMKPLFDELNTLGLNLSNPRVDFTTTYGSGHRTGGGDGPVQTRYRSRLFPRANWEDDGLFRRTIVAIRHAVETGHTFHGIMHAPSDAVAGWPGRNSSVNPAWRRALLHASLIDTQPVSLSAAQARQRDTRMHALLDKWRAITPDSGAYMNEGDPTEPDWQRSFYGDLYAGLVRIKRRHDPWGLFWAPTTPGSEAWEVRAVDGYPGSQNGPLCRAVAAKAAL